jgi:transcriptional regulator with XRE-family HTH domain
MGYAKLIREARKASGLSAAEVARRAGTSRPTLSAYENGRKVPTVETFERVLEATGFELDIRPRSATISEHWRVREYMHTLGRLGQVVSEERHALHLSVAELAEMSDVAASLIISIEAGTAQPDLKGVRRVLRSLGVKPLALPFDLLGSRDA